MIKSYAYDIEVLPNFFSITIISVNDYLKIFSDCVNDKNKAIPIVQKLSVKELKERLDKVESYSFYITDKDDSQLLTMLSFINNMHPYRNEKGVAVRSDMFGYNSMNYDKLMVAAFLMNATNCNNTKELITKLYETSKRIIELQDNKDNFTKDYYIDSLRNYNLPYVDIDIMRIFALNKCGKGVDKDGNTIYFPKSLKQTSINLQWYELLEYELPPISDKDNFIYTKNIKYKNFTNEQLNKLINKWDRHIINEWIPSMMHYNKNDVFIVCEIIRLNIEEIKSRYAISKAYEVNVLNSSRSNIADTLFEKFYSEFSGLSPQQWKGKKTERTILSFKKVIFPWIEFKTKPLQDLLERMKKVKITSIGKSAFKETVKINNLVYTIATGGLHSKDIPRELISNITFTGEKTQVEKDWSNITDDSYIYVHWDIASFYPSIMAEYNVAPAHINEGVFVKLIKWLRDTRVDAKHSKEEYIDGIQKDILVLVLKIIINSLYGKLGYQFGELYDRLAVLKVTINGQLMIMMLCEELEANNIEVVSANTDGIIVKLYKKYKDKFDTIANDWMNKTKLSADSEEYKAYINRDINNFAIEEINGHRSYAGDLHPLMHLKDLQKGYNMPIVAKAVVNYFLNNKPIMETLYEATNILDFCKTQNIGRQFYVSVLKFIDGTNKIETKEYQRNIRFYVANNGDTVVKIHKITGNKSSLCAGQQVVILNTLDDKNIMYRNINYNYYYKECLKIIDPIKLGISPKGRGKSLIKKNSGQYQSLFDDNDFK